MSNIFVKAPGGVKHFPSPEEDTKVIIKTHEKFNSGGGSEYFKKANNLSELDTEYKKSKARENLGIDLELLSKAVQISWDDNLDKLKITTLTDSFVSDCFEKIEPPASPTISVLEYVTITGSVNVSITNNKPGSQLYYSLNGETYQTTSGTISLDSGFANTSLNTNKTYKVYVKALYNGEYSSVNSYDIIIKPKCTPATFKVVRNNNNNNYSTQATITFNPSTMSGVKTYYSENNGSTWTLLESARTIIITSSSAAGKYRLKVESPGYESSQTSSEAITLNALKTYYGFSTKELIDSTDIITFTGVLEASSISKNVKYNITIPEPSYIWICQQSTLAPNSIFHESTDTIPAGFENAVKIGNYNCYRSIEIWKAGSSSIYLK